MKRIRLQEGRRSSERKVIYEGNGFCRVMKGGRLVERLQLEKGDNLLEALKGGKLMEGVMMKGIKSFRDFMNTMEKTEKVKGKSGLYTGMSKVSNFSRYQDDLEKIVSMGALDMKTLRGSYYGAGKTLSVKDLGASQSDEWYFDNVENVVQAIQILEWAFGFKKLDIEDTTPAYAGYADPYTSDFKFKLYR